MPLIHNSRTTTNPHNPICTAYFCLITSKFLYFQCEARCSEQLEWENYSAWVLSWWREFSSQPLTEFWQHILSGWQVCHWGIQYHLCSTYRGLWGLEVVQLSRLSGRALAAQARGVLVSTPDDCRPFHFPQFSHLNLISSMRQDALSNIHVSYIVDQIYLILETQMVQYKEEVLQHWYMYVSFLTRMLGSFRSCYWDSWLVSVVYEYHSSLCMA